MNKTTPRMVSNHRKGIGKGVIAIVIIVLVFAAAIASTLVYFPSLLFGTQPSAGSIGPAISAPCPRSANYSYIDGANVNTTVSASFPILVMALGGSGVICVEYAAVGSAKASGTIVNATGAVAVGNFTTKKYGNGTTRVAFVPTKAVAVTQSDTNLSLGGKSSPVSVVAFKISAGTVKGLYFLNIAGLFPTACNNEFRLAVGYTFNPANATGQFFPIPDGTGACTVGGSNVFLPTPSGVITQVYSVGGIKVVPLSCGSFTCDSHVTG